MTLALMPDNEVAVATDVGAEMTIAFPQSGLCTLRLPGDPGAPRHGRITINDEARLLLVRDDGLAYLGPAVDLQTYERLRHVAVIEVVELVPGVMAERRRYPADREDDFHVAAGERLRAHLTGKKVGAAAAIAE